MKNPQHSLLDFRTHHSLISPNIFFLYFVLPHVLFCFTFDVFFPPVLDNILQAYLTVIGLLKKKKNQ